MTELRQKIHDIVVLSDEISHITKKLFEDSNEAQANVMLPSFEDEKLRIHIYAAKRFFEVCAQYSQAFSFEKIEDPRQGRYRVECETSKVLFSSIIRTEDMEWLQKYLYGIKFEGIEMYKKGGASNE